MTKTETGQDEPCTIPWSALLLIAPPIAFFILSDLLFLYSGWRGVGDAPVATALTQGRSDAAARLYILAGFLAVAGMSFFALLSMGADLKRLFGPKARNRLIGGMSVGIAVACAYFLTLGSWVPIQKYVGESLLRSATHQYQKLEYCTPKLPLPPAATAPPETAAKAAPTPSPAPLVCQKEDIGRFAGFSLLDRFDWLMKAMRGMLIVAGFALIGGAVSCLAEPGKKLADGEAARFLAGQRNRLKRYVNLAAMLMVAGMAFMIAWMRWPLALMPPGMDKIYAAHVDALGIFFGVTYSLVIASYAVPVAATLRARVAAYQRDNATAEEPDLLDGTMMESLGKILIVLAPALTGLVPPVIDALSGLG